MIEAEVATIYPRVPDGKATDWARSVCADILQDEFADDALTGRIVQRFSGGDRPDPTAEQAAEILRVVRAGGWCESP